MPMYSAMVSSSFNTQPPEGGWYFRFHTNGATLLFQHTAA
ncbi:hypothetical protein HMPREF1051_1272 [Neisseria sicca VK64]|uniref:Uncharacterized protein n=1 Tax=Neisseria sicca VK64 TaxID=1095748 RepID=I2NX50_NEISI|nr:hypothetical protein HMPREF1051_1272 [Neisseria sicca VK64]